MTTLQQRIGAFTKLGDILKDASSPSPSITISAHFRKIMDRQEHNNKWFTPGNVILSATAIAGMLGKEKLEKWLDPYDLPAKNDAARTIAVIMAGNIPLVGFHDLLAVLVSGNRIMARTSSKDSELIMALADILIDIEPLFKDQIIFTDKIKGKYDAVIATGSDNTSRYFEYYFGRKPHMFRKNRNSLAIIDDNTKADDINKLGTDIFSYFGLGCRNVSMLYLEEGINPSSLIEHWSDKSGIINHIPYSNNYLYNKSLLNINKKEYTDAGFCLLKRDKSLSSPVSLIHYDYFSNYKELEKNISLSLQDIQCIVSAKHLPFGKTQYPEPREYADNIDTIEFINSLQ